MKRWQEVISSVAPTVAGALGGPLAGLAASLAGRMLLGKADATADQVKDFVLAHQTPETFAKLKEIEAELKVKLRELDIEEEKIAAGDRASARDRHAKTGDRMPGVLASVVFFGFFGILGALMFIKEIPLNAQQPLDIMLGALASLLIQIGAYYFGSSKGSADKTVILGRRG